MCFANVMKCATFVVSIKIYFVNCCNVTAQDGSTTIDIHNYYVNKYHPPRIKVWSSERGFWFNAQNETIFKNILSNPKYYSITRERASIKIFRRASNKA